MRLQLDYNIPVKNVLTLVIAIPVFLFFFDSLGYFFQYEIAKKLRVLFDITLEANIPTWYSSFIALLTGFAALLIVEHYYAGGNKFKITSWLLIALFFIYMSIDDTSQFHERVATVWAASANTADKASLSSTLVNSFESYYWQLLFLPLFGSLGLLMLYIIKTEFNNRLARILFIAGLSCFVFAVILDYIDGVDSYYEAIIASTGVNLVFLEHFSRAVEEMTEMIGLGFIFTSMLLHIDSLKN